MLLPAVAGPVALAANALIARRPAPFRPDTVLVAGAAVLALACLLAAAAPRLGPPALLLAAVLLGLAEGPQLTAVFAIRHREAPAGLRGQVFTTGASLKLTGFAAGAALAGQLAPWSPTGALLAAAGIHLLAVALGAALRTPRCARGYGSPRSAGSTRSDRRPGGWPH
ncbi:hypothetical protein ABT354_28530 [Streptomyces sp. NPDC000594]|uniref:hypothetical protein n=1 Tax=Streptomyces sp. NPDC000594 TaxID=3154261 RepID=UPI00331DEBF2